MTKFVNFPILFRIWMSECHIIHDRLHIYLYTRLDRRVIELGGMVVCCWQDKWRWRESTWSLSHYYSCILLEIFYKLLMRIFYIIILSIQCLSKLYFIKNSISGSNLINVFPQVIHSSIFSCKCDQPYLSILRILVALFLMQ